MKNIISLLLGILFLQSYCTAQYADDIYRFRDKVKTLTVEKNNDASPPEAVVTTLHFDHRGRVVKAETVSTIEEYLYLDTTGNVVLKRLIRRDKPEYKHYYLKEFDADGNLLLETDIVQNVVEDVDLYTYGKQQDEWLYFINKDEIYSHRKSEHIDLSQTSFPRTLVPFAWDNKASYGKDISSISYNNATTDHNLTYKFAERGNAGNYVVFTVNGDDVYDAGKGSWQRYNDGIKTEERYLYPGNDISDFGHRYLYNQVGKLTDDGYGYFDKMANGDYMQRKVISYNTHGDVLKERNTADGKLDYELNYTYTYDEHNNWLSQVSRFADASGRKTKRRFVYYAAGEQGLNADLSRTTYDELLALSKKQGVIARQKYTAYLAAVKQQENKPAVMVNYRTLVSGNWKDFLPAGNSLDTFIRGDLNKDGLDDVVFVYQPEKLLKHKHNTSRTLRILLQQPGGQYKLEAESPYAAIAESVNNIYFSSVEIKKGILIICNEFIRGGAVHKYRYQDDGFYLIGASSMTGDAASSESIDYNLSTGQYEATYDNYDDNKDLPSSYKKKGVQKIRPLPRIEDFELFSLDVAGFSL
jgi:hypothetical protein